MKYRTFLLDLDGTVFDTLMPVLKSAFSKMGVAANKEQYLLFEKINSELWQSLEKGEINRQQLHDTRFTRFFELTGLPKVPEANRIFVDTLHNTAELMGGAKTFLERLKEMGEIYVVTNGGAAAQKNRIKVSGLSKYFSGVFISEEAGYEKPDVRFFEYAAQRIEKFDKKNCLMIGDSLSADIAGGNAFGISTAWLNFDGTALPQKGIIPTYTAESYDALLSLIKR